MHWVKSFCFALGLIVVVVPKSRADDPFKIKQIQSQSVENLFNHIEKELLNPNTIFLKILDCVEMDDIEKEIVKVIDACCCNEHGCNHILKEDLLVMLPKVILSIIKTHRINYPDKNENNKTILVEAIKEEIASFIANYQFSIFFSN